MVKRNYNLRVVSLVLRALNRRPSLIIILEILDVLHKHKRMNLSQLCTYTRLSYSKLKNQVDNLNKAGLIEEIEGNGTREYALTIKGRLILFRLKEYVKSLSEAGLIDYQISSSV
ncbi:hypothetical protein DRN86_03565 [Candidatus Geothermarchaeota archaeon]|nr:MAG: hypothetical protein DRN86_03565 [Candidatus Geothermarchaeota archaeon]